MVRDTLGMRPPNATSNRWMRRLDLPLVGLGIVFSLALGAMIVTSSIRQLSHLETVLFQVVTLATGLLGSYRFGRVAAREAAYEMIRPHARSAIRRILELRDSLFRLSARIEDFKQDADDDRHLSIIQAIIDEQIPTGGSAVEDWRDIVPEDVDQILEAWLERRGVEQNDRAH